jgi:hypothetical protein
MKPATACRKANNSTSGALFTSGMKAAEVSTASGPAESARKSATVEKRQQHAAGTPDVDARNTIEANNSCFSRKFAKNSSEQQKIQEIDN